MRIIAKNTIIPTDTADRDFSSTEMRILFYYDIQGGPVLMLGTAHLYLKTYIDLHDPDLASKITWLPSQQLKLTDDGLVDLCNQQQVDVLCTSHYIWNHTYLIEQLERVRPRLEKHVILVAGGPSISVNIESDWFERFPFIDYAVYGAGEKAFYDLIGALISGKEIHKEFTSNISWFDQKNKKQTVAGYQYVPMIKTSPYLHNRDILTKMVEESHATGRGVMLPYELTRGCPYACTFCDWNSGLGNKVSRRKATYQEEIDLFFDLGIENIYLSDANVGMYEEDVELVKYIADKNLQSDHKTLVDGNYSKLNLKNNREIFHHLARGKLLHQGFVFSCQDVHEHILENIDRPDITWTQHSNLIDELAACYPKIPALIQLIQGLPGQTPASWRQTLKEVSKKSVMLMILINELLPASPAARDLEYQQKWRFTYSQSRRYSDHYLTDQEKFFRGNFAESCASFDREDLLQMMILSQFYTSLCAMRYALRADFAQFDIESMVDHFLGSRYYQSLLSNLRSNWNDDNFYYTINFDGDPEMVSACSVPCISDNWNYSQGLREIAIACVDDQQLRAKIKNSNRMKYYNTLYYQSDD